MTATIARPSSAGRQQLFAACACLWILCELSLMTALGRDHAQASWLFAGVAVDILLVLAGALYLSARAAGGYRHLGLSWQRWLRLATIAVVGFGLGLRLLGAPFGVAAAGLALEGVALGLALRAVRRGAGRSRAHLLKELGALLPAPVAAALVSELLLLRAAVAALRREPLPAPAGGFGTTATSRYGQVVACIALLTMVELPALHLLLHALLGPGRLAAHLLLIGLHGYGLLWLLGDWRLMREAAHLLGPSGLELHLGERVRGLIPYDLIDSTVARGEAPGAPGRRVTPREPPNVTLELRGPVTLSTYYGLPLRARRLHLYVDRPEALVQALTARRAG